MKWYNVSSLVLAFGVLSGQAAALGQVSMSDSTALVNLYNSTQGPDWSNSINWLQGPVRSWAGVTVDANRVTRINLGGNNLQGQIPESLGNLSDLRSLALRDNKLTGPIPASLGNLSDKLQSLELGFNELSGEIPPELGNLSPTAFLSLGLYYNQLTGPIPPELGNLSRLDQVSLHGNELTGAIPPELGLLESLRFLVLDGNDLSGPIPPELSGAISLESLSVLENPGLFGGIPLSLGSLPNLTSVSYSSTSLCVLPGSTFPVDINHPVQCAVQSTVPAVGASDGGYSVILRGVGFHGTESVTFGGIEVNGLTLLSDTRMSVIVPAGVEGSVVVTVSGNNGGQFSLPLSDGFRYTVPPQAPSGFSASGSSDGVALAWAAAADPDLSGFLIYRSENATLPSDSLKFVSSSSSSFQDATVVPGVENHYWIRAVNVSGQRSDAAGPVAATRPLSPITVPTGFDAIAQAASIRISWDASADGSISAYRLYRSVESTIPSDSLVSLDSSISEYTDTDVTSGVAYNYWLRAASDDGRRSEPAGPSTAAVAAQLPSIPTGLSAAAGDGSVRLTWTANQTGDQVTAYELRKRTAGGVFAPWTNVGPNQVEVVDNNVSNGVTYEYDIRAQNGQGPSAYSSPVAAQPSAAIDFQSPGVPTGLVVVGGVEEIAISWNANIEGDLAGYRLYRGGGPEGAKTYSFDSQVTAYSDRALQVGTAYLYTLTAFDLSGNESNPTPPASATASQAEVPPIAPAGLVATPGNRSIQLKWSPSSDNDIAWYHWWRTATNAPPAESVSAFGSVSASVSDLTDSAVENGVKYYYWLKAERGSGLQSGFSEPVAATPRSSLFTVSRLLNFGSSSATSSYRIISVPGSASIEVSTTFSGQHGTDWKLFYDTGATGGSYLQPYSSGNPVFRFAAGRAFWALASGTWAVSSADVPQVPLDSSDSYEIEVHSGWNLIANPFDLSIAWLDVEAANSISSSVFSWSGTDYGEATTLEPYQGYYWFNDTGRTRLVMPYKRPTTTARLTPPGLEISFHSSDGGSLGMVKLLDAPGSTATKAFEQPAPPSHFGSFSAVLLGPPGADHRDYLRLARSAESVSCATLRTRSSDSREVEVRSSSVVYLVPHDGSDVRRVDPAGTSVEMRETTVFSVVCSTLSNALGLRDQFLPEDFSVDVPFPNPTSGSVHLGLDLPRSGLVKLIAYDMLGREVWRRDFSFMAGGRERIAWPAIESSGSPITAGVYVLHVIYEGQSRTNLVTLVR